MLDDKQLKQEVLNELTWDPRVNVAHIGITAKGGVVTLTGHVEKYAEKLAAENAVRRVKGVNAIAEEIEVRVPFDVRHDDQQIATNAANRLKLDASLPKESITVKVEKGWVTLMGQVDWRYQYEAAAAEIRELWGVIGVSNQISLRAVPRSANIEFDINTALHRSWLNPMNVNVAVNGGGVTLSGSVNGWSEREQAELTAWAAPGVTSVTNNILVH
jgi:osmotically-inducible protein OsmY